MSLLVAYAPDERGAAALELAAMLARSGGDDLVVCTVVPAPWAPGLARVDAEYRAYLDRTARDALDRARAALPDDVRAEYHVEDARSAAVGLLAVAAGRDASAIVLGSSSAGPVGHVVIGSVSARLLHSSPLPLALTTRGFRSRLDDRVRRLTVAYSGDEGSDELVSVGAATASRLGATLRLATFVVPPPGMVTAGVGPGAEKGVTRDWEAGLAASREASLQRIGGAVLARAEVETVIGYGPRWAEALDDVPWTDGDLLVVGSSAVSTVAQVFLGSRAAKIVRHSPVPVVVVPRG